GPGDGVGAVSLHPPAALRGHHHRGGAGDAARRAGAPADEVSIAEDDLTTDAALRVIEVHKHFGGVRAVNGVSLSLEPGRIYGLIGPNGSGKTTLFNCITGVEHLDSGRILLDGAPIEGLRPWEIARRGVGRTFQVIRVFPEL